MVYYTIYGFNYIIKSKIFEFCKNIENVKGLKPVFTIIKYFINGFFK